MRSIVSSGAVYCAVQGGSHFWVCGWNPKVWPFKWKLLNSIFQWCWLLCCRRWFQFCVQFKWGNEKCDHANESYWATEQYFPAVLFIMLCKVVLTSESVDENLKCDHSNESYWTVLSSCAVYYVVEGASNFVSNSNEERKSGGIL